MNLNDVQYYLWLCNIQYWLNRFHGFLLWTSLHPLSSSHGWCYNILLYDNGELKYDLKQKCTSINLTQVESLAEGVLDCLNKIKT